MAKVGDIRMTDKARKKEQRALRMRISNLLDEHCDGCTKLSHIPHDSSAERYRYCNTQCEIGRKIQALGQQLERKGGTPIMEPAEVLREKDVLTREKYLAHKQAGWNDSQIRKQYGFKFPNDLTAWKKNNGLDGYRIGGKPEQHEHVDQKTRVQEMPRKNEDTPPIKEEPTPTNAQEELPIPPKASANEDPANHPSHYTAGNIECIDAIDAATIGLTGGQAYSIGAAINHLWSWSRNGSIEDLKMAKWHIDRLIEQRQR